MESHFLSLFPVYIDFLLQVTLNTPPEAEATAIGKGISVEANVSAISAYLIMKHNTGLL